MKLDGHIHSLQLAGSGKEKQQKLLADMAKVGIDGGLLISSISPNLKARHQEILGNLPCVYLGVNHDEDCSHVTADNEKGGYIGTKYLLDLGHRDIWFVGGRAASRTRDLRIRGFMRAMEEAGLTGRTITTQPNMSFMRDWTTEEALEVLQEPLPDAIFAFCVLQFILDTSLFNKIFTNRLSQ